MFNRLTVSDPFVVRLRYEFVRLFDLGVKVLLLELQVLLKQRTVVLFFEGKQFIVLLLQCYFVLNSVKLQSLTFSVNEVHTQVFGLLIDLFKNPLEVFLDLLQALDFLLNQQLLVSQVFFLETLFFMV